MNKGLSQQEELRRLDVVRTALKLDDAEYDRRRAEIMKRFAAAPAREPQRAASPQRSNEALRPFDPDDRLLVAPYRFASLNKKVADSPLWADSFDRSARAAGCYSARLTVTFESETPLLIGKDDGSGAAVPLSLHDEERLPWWVPGASLRGMLRSACEILGHGRLEQTNGHYVFPLRNFEHPHYHYKGGSEAAAGPKLGNTAEVRIGWLKSDRVGNAAPWRIYESKLAYVAIDDILQSLTTSVKNRESWNTLDIVSKYGEVRQLLGRSEPDYQKSTSMRSAPANIPGQTRWRPEETGEDWVLVFSNKSPKAASPTFEKKWEYAAKPFNAAAPSHVLIKPSVDRFLMVHTSPGRGDKRDPDGTWAVLAPLVEQGKPVPVFYVGDPAKQGGDFAFGLTRLFKLPHKISQGEMIGREKEHQRPEGVYRPDMVSALFGFVDEVVDENGMKREGTALKGRIAISGARIGADIAMVAKDGGKPFETVMGTPRASFAPFYLEGTIKDWSLATGDTRIAGRKRYVPRVLDAASQPMEKFLDKARERFRQQVLMLSPQAQRNEKLRSKMSFLVNRPGKSLSFTNVIDLRNVHAAELGLVLWALTFGGGAAKEKYRHMLGRAKAFGFGQLKVQAVEMRIAPNDPSAQLAAQDEFIRAFEVYMEKAGLTPFRDQACVKDFLASCDPANGARLKDAAWRQFNDAGTSIYVPLTDHKKLRAKPGQKDSVRRYLTLPVK
jgi:CRISPR-associated protein (TIGR03986 family)